MGTWMGLCCLLVTRSSFSSNDLHVASRACSLASMLSSRKQIVWLMEYRNDCKRKGEPAQKGGRATGDSGTDPALGARIPAVSAPAERALPRAPLFPGATGAQNRGRAPPPRVSPVPGRSSGGVRGVQGVPRATGGTRTSRPARLAGEAAHGAATAKGLCTASLPPSGGPGTSSRCAAAASYRQGPRLPAHAGPGEPLASPPPPPGAETLRVPRICTRAPALVPAAQGPGTRWCSPLGSPRWGWGRKGAGLRGPGRGEQSCRAQVAHGASRESTGVGDGPARWVGPHSDHSSPSPRRVFTTRLQAQGRLPPRPPGDPGAGTAWRKHAGHRDNGGKCREAGGPCRRRTPWATTELQPQRAASKAVGGAPPGQGGPWGSAGVRAPPAGQDAQGGAHLDGGILAVDLQALALQGRLVVIRHHMVLQHNCKPRQTRQG